MIVPTKDNIEAWIEKSKAYGATLNNRASMNASPNRNNSLQFSTNFDIASNPYDAIEIDPRMRSMGRSDEPPFGRNRINLTSG